MGVSPVKFWHNSRAKNPKIEGGGQEEQLTSSALPSPKNQQRGPSAGRFLSPESVVRVQFPQPCPHCRTRHFFFASPRILRALAQLAGDGGWEQEGEARPQSQNALGTQQKSMEPSKHGHIRPAHKQFVKPQLGKPQVAQGAPTTPCPNSTPPGSLLLCGDWMGAGAEAG